VSRIARLPRLLGPLPTMAFAVLVLSGCAAGQISQTAQEVAAIDGGNGQVGHIAILNATLATPQGSAYAKGSNAPLQVWVTNDGVSDDTLTGVSTPAATKVAIAGKAVVPGHSLQKFVGGQVNITLNGLTHSITYGKTVPVTFNFVTAGSVTIDVPVETPDARTTGRPEIKIEPSEGASLWQASQTGGRPTGTATHEVVATTGGS
jgi:copper(I)-binding protein